MVKRLGGNGEIKPFNSVLDDLVLIMPYTEILSAEELQAMQDKP